MQLHLGLGAMAFRRGYLQTVYSLLRLQNTWSKLKQLLRSQAARTYETLHQSLTQVINSVTEDDAFGWFARCGLFI